MNADVKGELRVEVLDERGQALPGYTAAECRPICSDSLRHRVRWKRHSSVELLRGRNVRLRFLLREGDLYSFRFKLEAADGKGG